MAHTTTEVVHHMIYFNNRIINLTKLDKVKNLSKEEVEIIIKRMITFYGSLQSLSSAYLVAINASLIYFTSFFSNFQNLF